VTKSDESAKMSSTSDDGFNTCVLLPGDKVSPGVILLVSPGVTLLADVVTVLTDCVESTAAAAESSARG